MYKLFFPINIGDGHWLVVVAYMQQSKIQVYDSLDKSGVEWMNAVFHFIMDEHFHKKGWPLPEWNQWQLVSCHRGTPRQLNGKLCHLCQVYPAKVTWCVCSFNLELRF
jgi:Ulp1 family protease